MGTSSSTLRRNDYARPPPRFGFASPPYAPGYVQSYPMSMGTDGGTVMTQFMPNGAGYMYQPSQQVINGQQVMHPPTIGPPYSATAFSGSTMTGPAFIGCACTCEFIYLF